jgi:hypothetical protein
MRIKGQSKVQLTFHSLRFEQVTRHCTLSFALNLSFAVSLAWIFHEAFPWS